MNLAQQMNIGRITSFLGSNDVTVFEYANAVLVVRFDSGIRVLIGEDIADINDSISTDVLIELLDLHKRLVMAWGNKPFTYRS